MNLKPLVILGTLVLILTSCQRDLRRERQAYEESLHSYNVAAYKAAKTLLRASADMDTQTTTISGMFKLVNDTIGEASEMLKWISSIEQQLAIDSNGTPIETVDYLKLAGDVWRLRGVLNESDEDKYPLFLERCGGKRSVYVVDSVCQAFGYHYTNSMEHLMFAVPAAVSVKMPNDIVLYELSKVDPSELGNNDLLLLHDVLEALYFMLNKWHYLSEEKSTAMIEHLEEDPYQAVLLLRPDSTGRTMLHDQEQATSFMSVLAYAMRASARFQMEDKSKKKDAQKDIVRAVELANQAGFQFDELTLAAAAYSIQLGDEDKARELCDQVANGKGSDETREYARRISGYIQDGNEDAAQEELTSRLDDHTYMIGLVKELAWYTLDKEGFTEHLGEEVKDNPVKATVAFLKIYLLEYGHYEQYARLEYYNQKVGKWLD